MAGVVHTLGLYQWAAGLMIPSNTFKAILLTGHTPDKANEFVSDIVSDEIAETYTRPTVSSVAFTTRRSISTNSVSFLSNAARRSNLTMLAIGLPIWPSSTDQRWDRSISVAKRWLRNASGWNATG